MDIRVVIALSLLAARCTSGKPLDSLAVDDTNAASESSPDDSEPPVETGDSNDSRVPDDTGPFDADGDGWSAGDDCDDGDASIHPGAPDDYCDGLDRDCDGVVGVAHIEGVEHSTIQGALDTISSEGTVRVCPGLHTESLTIDDVQGMALESVSGSYADTVLSGEGAHRILWVGEGIETAVKNLSLINGAPADCCGGAIYAAASLLSLEGCYFADNEVTDHVGGSPSGGAVFWEGMFATPVELVVDDCVFENNRAQDGGAIYVGGSTWQREVVIDGSRFEDNTADGYGGSMHVTSIEREVTVDIRDSVFENSSAFGSGGAIYGTVAMGTTLRLADSSFLGNSTEDDGGTLYWYGHLGATLSVEGSDFQGNTAEGVGGAIYFVSSHGAQDVLISESSFTDNSAGDSGGALNLYSHEEGTLSIVGSTIENNTAGTTGGLTASAVDGSYQATFQQVDFAGNLSTSVSGAGGLMLYLRQGGTVEIQQGSFTSNTGAQSGGAYIYSDEDVVLTSTDVDWGEGATDNSPYDLVGWGEYLDDLGTNETLTCDSTGCF